MVVALSALHHPPHYHLPYHPAHRSLLYSQFQETKQLASSSQVSGLVLHTMETKSGYHPQPLVLGLTIFGRTSKHSSAFAEGRSSLHALAQTRHVVLAMLLVRGAAAKRKVLKLFEHWSISFELICKPAVSPQEGPKYISKIGRASCRANIKTSVE